MLVREATLTLKNGASVRLRSPTTEDAHAALEFIRKLSHESWRNLNHAETHFDGVGEAAEAAVLDAYVRHPKDFMISAWQDDAVVGNIGCRASHATLNAHCGEIGMGVLLALHRKGLGEGLLRAAIDEADRAGVWNLSLRVRVHNDPAIRLYEKVGFERIGTMRSAAKIDAAFVDEYVYQRLGSAFSAS
jgi:RimJ/RimL family protein N-acetyltransferase